MSDTNTDAARKRRIAMRNQKRSFPTEGEDESNKRLRMEDEGEEPLAEPVTSKPKPHITGIKKQSRYDPGVPMTREELKAWRKEARRVRNRESAAASRKKNREQVALLQDEVDNLKSKYAAALKHIMDLEASRSVNDRASFAPPALLRQDLLDAHQGITRPASPGAVQTVSPPHSPATQASVASNEVMFFGLNLPQCPGQPSQQSQQAQASQHNHQHHNTTSHQHLTMISRPIAAKILPGADAADSPVMTAVDGNNVSCHDNGNHQDNVPPQSHMNMTFDAWNMKEMERLAAPPAPASISDSGSSECSDDVPLHHDSLNDSELGEFLMDSFPGVDVMAVMDEMPELAAI